MSNENMLKSFVLPYQKSETFEGPAALMSSFCSILKNRINEINIVHAMSGGYLAEHMQNIDVRVAGVLSSETFKELKARHITEKVEPELEKARSMIDRDGTECVVNLIIEDGKPAEVIYRAAKETACSTIIMERRDLSRMEEMVLGGVTSTLLHSDLNASMYLSGTEPASRDCRCMNCLVALDGSGHSKAALKEASVLLGACREMNQVVLLTVIDTDDYGVRIERGEDPAELAANLMDGAVGSLMASGVPEEKIVKVIGSGSSIADIVKEEVEKHHVDMVFLGRRGASTLSEVVFGSVSRKIINLCYEQTVVLVTE